MANKTKAAVLIGCGVLFAGAAAIAAFTVPETADGEKNFTFEVYSERDDFSSSEEYSSDCEYFGQWCREQDFIGYSESEYGIYIHSVNGFEEDMDEQYWWCVMVDGESAALGADFLPITDGSSYRLELKQGW
ncbi:MAG: DUF4430 domain-containing protein [Oscillospiraceae bacterium]|nr:DUF4430 domain-containing protein [Oscillospiraceae bacterium]